MSASNGGFNPHAHSHAAYSDMSAMALPASANFAHVPTGHASFYASSHASASSSSLADQLSDHESYSGSFEPQRSASLGGVETRRLGPGRSSSSQGFPCPNCGKVFARDDLLRRHLAREARALAQPSFDRQKSCYECARSKARCDLEVPTCGRCRARGKQCVYAPRSGNPNVRKARNVGMMPNMQAHIHAITPQMTPAIAPAVAMGSSMASAGWAMHNQGFALGSNSFMAPNPAYVKSEGEHEYDSHSDSEAHSWHDPASSASGSVFGSPRSQHGVAEHPDSAPPNFSNFNISTHTYPSISAPMRTESPHSFHELNLATDAAPGPQRINSRKSSGFSRTNTGPIVTNMNRSDVAFANEEGEETPVVRTNHNIGHTASDTSRMQAGVNNNFLSAPQSRHRTTSLPETVENTLPEAAAIQAVWNARESIEASAYNEHSARQIQHASAATTTNTNTTTTTSTGAGTGEGAGNVMMPPPKPPTLITANLNTRPAWPNASPLRSLVFQPGLDLSGWLAEPVVPSPLYRMGPSLHSAIHGNFSALAQSPIVDASLSTKFPPAFAPNLGLDANSAFVASFPPGASRGGEFRYDCNGQVVMPAPRLPSAKQWWMHPRPNGEVVAAIVQASVAHFVTYPALMVLTDPTAPIPAFMHRKWLQENRRRMPETLASARSILAGYYVRLPASEAFVWRMISEQIREVVGRQAKLSEEETDVVEVFGAVAALWMYLVLVVFTDGMGGVEYVDEALVARAMGVLEVLAARLLVHAVEAWRGVEGGGVGGMGGFGWIETMVRTLFAVYSLLVLERFRKDGGVRGEGRGERLEVCSLVLDIPLPVGAGEFEADNETDWLQAHRENEKAILDGGALLRRPTLRQLVQVRNEMVGSEEGEKHQERGGGGVEWVERLFDGQDEFTNVVLSVAFALDDIRI